MTNLERIKTAPIEKLAKMLGDLGAGDAIEDIMCKKCPYTITCDESGTCVFKDDMLINVWLRQEETV